jgi:hypothetical protein
MEKDLGMVQTGKIADLVLLDANPLDDVSNTRKIRGVVLNGRYLDHHAVDKLPADAAAVAATRWSPPAPPVISEHAARSRYGYTTSSRQVFSETGSAVSEATTASRGIYADLDRSYNAADTRSGLPARSCAWSEPNLNCYASQGWLLPAAAAA